MHKCHIRAFHSQSEIVHEPPLSDRNKTVESVEAQVKPSAVLLRHNEIPCSLTSIQRQEVIFELQRQLGNTHVGRMLEAQRGAIHSHSSSGRSLLSIVKQTA